MASLNHKFGVSEIEIFFQRGLDRNLVFCPSCRSGNTLVHLGQLTPSTPVESAVVGNPRAHRSPIASAKASAHFPKPALVPDGVTGQEKVANSVKRAHASRATAKRRLRKAVMTLRSRRETVTFKHPFRLRGVDRLLPAGSYEVITDEEMIEGLSFAAFRRVATMIEVRAETGMALEMISIGSVDLADAQRTDASAPK
jgi:hypothetical protein